MDRECPDPPGAARRLMHAPPLPLIENFPERNDDACVVLLARNFFVRWAVQTDQVIISDTALFRIKFRERFGIPNRAIRNNDCSSG